MIGHPLVGILGCDSPDQFGGAGVSGDNGEASGFSSTQRFFPVDKGDPVLLSDSSMAGNTVLVENRADIPTEIYSIPRKQLSYVR